MHIRTLLETIRLQSSETTVPFSWGLTNDAPKIITNKLHFHKAKSQIVQDNLRSCL